MKDWGRRANGKGSAIFLSGNRAKPWGARISIGKDKNDKIISHFINFFETELRALVCLENYNDDPYPLYIKEDKYKKIVTFPRKPYPLVSVANPNNKLIDQTKLDTHIFKQVFEDFKLVKFPNKQERKLENEYHIKGKGKIATNTSKTMITAFNSSPDLHDRIYRELRTADFRRMINSCDKSFSMQENMLTLYKNLDTFALEEGIIENGYARNIRRLDSQRVRIRKREQEIPFTYEQIQYLWDFTPKAKEKLIFKEELVRDVWLLGLYTGCRAGEICFIYTKNIFLDENYFVGGLKTKAGINREIPIHPDIKHLFKKYYNPDNEFLLMIPNESGKGKGKRINYDYYERCYNSCF